MAGRKKDKTEKEAEAEKKAEAKKKDKAEKKVEAEKKAEAKKKDKAEKKVEAEAEAEEPAKAEAEEPAKAEAEEPAKAEAEEPAKAEAEEPAKAEAEEPAKAEAEEPADAGPQPIEVPADARYSATGKRKTSVARVILRSGKGAFELNGRTLESYFPRPTLQALVRQPLELTGYTGRLDVRARIHGGGVSGQADAVRHGIAKALMEVDPQLRTELKRRQQLTRDPRVKERRKAEGAAALKEAASAARHIGALAFLHDTDKALAAYREAVDLDPDNADGWNRLGYLLRRTGDLDNAEQACRRVLALGNRVDNQELLAVATGNLGILYSTRGDLDRAEEMYGKSLALNEA
ncbi:hypothetical protein LCGC14_2895770, partial [marine sediment metagenome]